MSLAKLRITFGKFLLLLCWERFPVESDANPSFCFHFPPLCGRRICWFLFRVQRDCLIYFRSLLNGKLTTARETERHSESVLQSWEELWTTNKKCWSPHLDYQPPTQSCCLNFNSALVEVAAPTELSTAIRTNSFANTHILPPLTPPPPSSSSPTESSFPCTICHSNYSTPPPSTISIPFVLSHPSYTFIRETKKSRGVAVTSGRLALTRDIHEGLLLLFLTIYYSLDRSS